MLKFGDADNDAEEAGEGVEFTRRFAILTVASQAGDPRTPHAYQLEAWERLNAHLAESRSTGVFQGLLVMPTGSGKTYTAVRWLCNHVLSSGKRVLWLAHRHELLTHAAAEFHRLAGYAAPREKLRVRVVSAAHCASSQIDPADDVVIASVHSLARRKDIAEQLLSDERLFVVIDEAHHAPAKSYRDLIAVLQQRSRWSVLGLTATPTRTLEEERPILRRLFGGRVLCQVELARLIEQRILARPVPVVVKTHADVEQGITPEDRGFYDRFNELSEEWLDRIAHLAGRNELIVDHYLQSRQKYGPTLVFAINVPHAALLTEAFRRAGVRADYVASYRPDGSEGDPLSVIQRFRCAASAGT
jgi:superfamily II DNA or RNA helicase